MLRSAVHSEGLGPGPSAHTIVASYDKRESNDKKESCDKRRVNPMTSENTMTRENATTRESPMTRVWLPQNADLDYHRTRILVTTAHGFGDTAEHGFGGTAAHGFQGTAKHGFWGTANHGFGGIAKHGFGGTAKTTTYPNISLHIPINPYTLEISYPGIGLGPGIGLDWIGVASDWSRIGLNWSWIRTRDWIGLD